MLPRADFDLRKAQEIVKPMLEQVKTEGVQALYRFARQFDQVEQDPAKGGAGIRVPEATLKQAYDELDPELRDALEEARARITKVHTAQLPARHTCELSTTPPATVTQRWFPIRRVGLYVPGGIAVYPSSVLMNAIPALCAGVQELAIVSPPQAQVAGGASTGAFNGLPHPTILAAAHMLGVKEVYAAGGAGAVGLLTYGVQGVDPVDLITGPGNIYVAAAKQVVQGIVGIDAVAGPTEIAILADETAVPKYVAVDLIGQAEHDPLAGSVLITNSEQLARDVRDQLAQLVPQTKHSERVATALSGQQSAIVLVNCLKDAIAAANAYGAEHLEIQTSAPQEVAEQITNAGAIFVGNYSPVPLGDYIGGSNHVLPTGGASRFSSGLGVQTFLRSVQQIEYSRDALLEVTDHLVALANNEDLPAHGEAVLARRD
jgi:histidinol dehydrogenase